jgi:uncharacterized protein (TIGR01627 family)
MNFLSCFFSILLYITPTIFAQKDYIDLILSIGAGKSGQMSLDEYSLLLETLGKKAPCNFLVFGVGNDSKLWLEINKNGRTVFLEDSEFWLNKIRASFPLLEGYLVFYNTKRSEWKKRLAKDQQSGALMLDLPSSIKDVAWDIIFVDAPCGYSDQTPGRMKSIYTASELAKNNYSVDVFVHDCDRTVEQVYSDTFLKKENMIIQVQRLRQYRLSK